MTPHELRELRACLNLTQTALATKLGITRSQVAKLESGGSVIRGAVRVLLEQLKNTLAGDP